MADPDLNPFELVADLSRELDIRARCVREACDWYDGRHPLPVPPPGTPAAVRGSEAEAAFYAAAKLAITNMLPPIVDVPASAVIPEGFRFGEVSANDQDAWAIWQRNHLDADMPLAIHAAVKTGQSFVIVWPGPDGLAEITPEDPSQVIVEYEAGSRRRRKAALKRWADDDGRMFATLYLPNAIYKFEGPASSSSELIVDRPTPVVGSVSWTPREVPGETWPLRNPFGVVPVVELRANASLAPACYGGGRPQFWKQINEQKKLNRTVLGLLIAEDNQSFRQRWATDWAYPTNDDGTPDLVAMARFSASRMAVFESEDGEHPVKVGEFAQADFRQITEVMLQWVKVMSATSGTPHYHFSLGDMVNVAADVLARIDGAQIGVRERLAADFGESIEEATRLALLIEGNPKASDMSSSVVWKEFERRTVADQIDYARTLKELGAPAEAVLAALPGVDQQTAARWALEQSGRMALQAVLAGPTA